MGRKKQEIKCPHCGKNIVIDDTLAQTLGKILWPNDMHVNDEVITKLKEKDQLIESLKNQLKGMSRKIEQSAISQQLQGEVAELLLEEFLTRTFPLDLITEIPKGQKGGDCIQLVNTRESQSLATILYESKKTRSWSPNWIPKMKEDVKRANCMFGIIVSESMPNDSPQMTQIEGIWVCRVQEVKVLATILREAAIITGMAINSVKDTGEKKQLLYKYLTSTQFKMEIQAVMDSFLELDKELSREKRAMSVYWKNREANIKRALKNTMSLYGSFKSIGGNAIPVINDLELAGNETLAIN